MKALLKKDILTLVKQMKIFLLMIVVFACLPGYSVSSFAVIYSAMLPITALAYDERAKWDSFAAMLPYSPYSIVGSKYVLGALGVALATALSSAVQLIMSALRGTSPDPSYFISLSVMVALALLMQAVMLPLMFRLGVEKGRVALFILMAVLVAGGMASSAYLEQLLMRGGMVLSALLLIGAGILLSIISFFVSVACYRRKE